MEFRLNEEQLLKLAELIAEKVLDKQKEYDEQFKLELEELASNNKNLEINFSTEKDFLLQEKEKLQELLLSYEADEKYLKAKEVKDKLDIIERELKKYE
jgi:hypothetical protein